MNIQVPITHYEDVELSDAQQKEIASKVIRKLFDIPDTAFIKEGKLMKVEEYYTSHSWDEDVYVREATELDKVSITMLKAIREA